MILPFVSRTKKAYWGLLVNEERINWAIEERDTKDFEKELRALYPALERCGVKMPAIDPVKTGEERYDGDLTPENRSGINVRVPDNMGDNASTRALVVPLPALSC